MKLQLSNVTKQFKHNGTTQSAIENISLTVNPAEFVCIVGPSGCGKTTILNIIAGLEQPTSGTMEREGKLGLMFQEASLFPWLTVRKNIAFGLRMQRTPQDQIKSTVEKYLQMVHLTNFADAYPHQLSGGMKQRAALARTLAIEPDILLMDEPFGALDEITRDKMNLELLRILKEERTIISTTIFITHSISEAVFLSDRIIILSQRPAKVEKIISVDLPWPRRTEVKYSEKYIELIECIKKILKED